MEPASLRRSKEPAVNRRQNFRIDLTHCLLAEMTITMFKGRSIRLGSTEVFVRNIGPGGLRFMVGVKLPVNSDILLKFKTRMDNQMYVLYGFIVWYNELDNDIHEYGVQFQWSEQENDELVNALHILDTRQRDGIPPQTQIYVGDPMLRIKELKKIN
ncbi:PilZ domain-containing protein [Paenibacillus sp. Soil522]|uniref:PilZ domain-containing protein n=1 Tax=Paenibacillus sp. Soil522 TaxID=1736388 RepID=UPI002E0E2369